MNAMQHVEVIGATDPAAIALARGVSKYAPGVRVPLFGHAGHTAFRCQSTTYVDVPGTYSSSWGPQRCKCRLEVMFAAPHDKALRLRMFDPANPGSGHRWELEFVGGHAPNTWWNFQVTDVFQAELGEPWPRQNTLQIRSNDGSEVILASVAILVTDLIA